MHFPIALLAAAAIGEALRIATGKLVFDAIVRYCIWFSTVTAVVAGALGWFLGGFHLSDASYILMTHRCLGTATVACAVLVLLLSEVSHHSDRPQNRIWFRVTLLVATALVMTTAFFGGAIVFGLNHYAWPQ